jgi:hypothetical protein
MVVIWPQLGALMVVLLAVTSSPLILRRLCETGEDGEKLLIMGERWKNGETRERQAGGGGKKEAKKGKTTE